MKHLICGIIMAVSFFIAIGIIGGLQVDTLTIKQAVTGFTISLAIFFAAGRIGGVIE